MSLAAGNVASVTHRMLLAVALPVMLSNLLTPLIGIVDTAAVGRLPEPYHIGAVAVGALIFDFVFWAFGFLRMGTSGFTAQAEGAGDDQELRDILTRAIGVALVFGVVLILVQPLIAHVAFALVDGSAEVEREARAYFDIRIWSAPAALANYAFFGFFIGLGRARTVIYFVLLVSTANAGLDAFFVLVLGMAADGVALGTLIAETAGSVGAVWLVAREFRNRGGSFSMAAIWHKARLKRMMQVNVDILIRSVLLVFAFSWFTAQSAGAGDVVLAANAVLINLFMVMAYFLDGFAFAAETYVGQSIGARRREIFWQAVRLSTIWAFVIAAVVSMLFFVFGGYGIDLLTVNEDVRRIARIYLPWTAIAPVIGFWCFQLDGIFIGATQTRDMRNMMLITIVIYLAAWWLLVAAFDNHGRWASIMVLVVVRAGTLAARLPALDRAAVPGRS